MPEIDFQTVADWLGERLEKMRNDLPAEEQYVVDVTLAMVADLLAHAYPTPDLLASAALARRTLLNMAALYQRDKTYREEWRPDAYA